VVCVRFAPLFGATATWCILLGSCSRTLLDDSPTDPGPSDATADANGCGGSGVLTLKGGLAVPGAPCGPCGDGVVVCASREAVVCLGAGDASACSESGPGNACGGTEPLTYDGAPASPGDPCGPCQDGALVCAGTALLTCLGARAASSCSADASVDASTDAAADADAGESDAARDAAPDANADAAPPPCTIPSSAYTAPAPPLPTLPPEPQPTSDSASYVE